MKDSLQAAPSTFGLVRGHLSGNYRFLAVALITSLIAAVLTLTEPMLIGLVIQRVERGLSPGPPAALLALVATATAVFTAIDQNFTGRAAEGLGGRLRASTIRSAFRLPLNRLRSIGASDISTRVLNDPPTIQNAATSAVIDSVVAVVTLGAAVTALVLIDATALGIAAAIAAAAFAVALVAGRGVRSLRWAIQADKASLGSSTHEAVEVMHLLRSYQSELHFQESTLAASEQLRRDSLRMTRLHSVVGPLSSLLLEIALMSAVVVGGAGVASGRIHIASFVTFIMYFQMCLGPFATLTGSYIALQEARASTARLGEVSEGTHGPSAVHGGSEPFVPTPVESFARRRSAVVFESVSLDGSHGRPILRNVSLTIPAGAFVAVVGPSGAGKSSLLQVLLGLQAPSAGQIRYGGLAGELATANLLREAAYVDQEATCISGTVLDNLRLAHPELPRQDARRALQRVGLASSEADANALLNRDVGSQGSRLSGGERQRLAVARLICKKAALLVLDEPTSSVDAECESVIASMLREEHDRGCTIVVAAHQPQRLPLRRPSSP